MARPTDEQIKLVRDAFLEAYVRRNPEAQPEPGTSLYAVLEATGAVLSSIIAAVPEVEDAIHDFLEEDRREVIQPDPDERAFLRMKERDEKGKPTGKDNPERKALEADQWPCVRNSEGSF